MKNLMPFFISEQYKNSNLKETFKAYTMFVDISGFTKLTETLMIHKKDGAEVLTDVLNIIFNPIVNNIYKNNGIVTTYAGDAFTAIFMIDPGIENTETDNCIINSALYINKYLNDNREIETKYGIFEIGVKVGLSYGEVAWGIIGKNDKNTYYFKSEAIEGCTKSEKNAKKGEIILDDKIIKQLKIDKKHLTDKKNGYGILSPEFKGYESKKIKSVTHKFTRVELQPFIFDSILNSKSKAEFREVVSVFISFDQSVEENILIDFVIELIEESFKHGGYFNKIDFGDKGGVALVLFGAPISYENNVERALNFILQIKHKISELKFRAGITCGIVYAGIVGGQERCEYTAIGDIVNLSARYMMKAEWNKYWIGENIVKKVNKFYEFKKAGVFEFKGKTGKIPVYELIKKKESSEPTLFEGGIVGREEELDQIGNFIKPVFKDKFAGIIYIYGEAGIGKSRLVWELKKQVFERVNWLYFPCEEILRKSFNPIIYFLKNYFNVSQENSKEQNRRNFENQYNKVLSSLTLKKSTKTLKEIISELHRTKTIIGGYLGIEWEDSIYSELDAKGKYENFLYAVKNMIKAKSLIKPVIIELEDSHWIDSDTEIFIKILTRNIENFSIILISASRYNDDGTEFELDLDKEVKVDKIDLNFLSKSNVSKYAAIVLNSDKKLSVELLDFIYEKTNGNPFFTEQLLLDLKELNLIKINKQNELYSDEKELKNIPSNIKAVVISRLDRLSDDIKEIVQTASVLGREFLIRILTQILKEEKELDKKLNFIEKEKIWSALSEIKYIFKHALLRDSAYDMQLLSRLKELHKFAAESYEEVFKNDLKEHYGDIAYHYQRAEIEDKAIEYLEKAGDYAKENYHNKDAIGFYSILIDNYQLSTINYIDILLKKGEILKLIGKWDEAEKIYKECLDKAEDSGNKKYIAKCSRLLGWQLQSKGNYKEAMEFYEEELTISKELGDKKGISKALGDMGTLYWYQRDYNKAMKCYEKSLSICEELSDKREISRVVGNMGLIYTDQGNYKEAMECYEKGLTIKEKLGDKININSIFANIGLVCWNQGDSKKATEYFEKDLIISQELGDKSGLCRSIGNMGVVYQKQGNYTKAMEFYERGLAISQELGDKVELSRVLRSIGGVYENQGDYTKAMNFYEKALIISEELSDKKGKSIVIGNMGKIYQKQGNYSKALEYFDKSISIGRELNVKFLLCSYLLNKATLLFIINDPKADSVNKEALKISLEISEKYIIFNSKILKEKINFKFSDNNQKKIKNIENLKSKLKDEKKDANIATLNYEITIMLDELNKDSSEFKNKAITIYKKLYKKTPYIAYKDRYEELEKLN